MVLCSFSLLAAYCNICNISLALISSPERRLRNLDAFSTTRHHTTLYAHTHTHRTRRGVDRRVLFVALRATYRLFFILHLHENMVDDIDLHPCGSCKNKMMVAGGCNGVTGGDRRRGVGRRDGTAWKISITAVDGIRRVWWRMNR